jgi:hypothetical protein
MAAAIFIVIIAALLAVMVVTSRGRLARPRNPGRATGADDAAGDPGSLRHHGHHGSSASGHHGGAGGGHHSGGGGDHGGFSGGFSGGGHH